MEDPEKKREFYKRAGKFGLILLAAAATASIAWYAVVGLIGWTVAGAIFLVVSNYAPAFGAWLANKKLEALKEVIERNPIETMENLYIEKKQEFKRQEDAVTEFDTQFQNVSQLVDGLKKSDPAEAVEYAKMRDKMEEGLEELRHEQQLAQDELVTAKMTIDKMRRLWTVQLALNKALSASASAQKQVFDQIKQDVSVDTVRTNLNRAFARLNTAVERRRTNPVVSDAPKELPPPTSVIDVTPQQKTKVLRG